MILIALLWKNEKYWNLQNDKQWEQWGRQNIPIYNKIFSLVWLFVEGKKYKCVITEQVKHRNIYLSEKKNLTMITMGINAVTQSF